MVQRRRASRGKGGRWDEFVVTLRASEYAILRDSLLEMMVSASGSAEVSESTDHEEKALSVLDSASELQKSIEHKDDVGQTCQLCFHAEARYLLDVEVEQHVDRVIPFCEECVPMLSEQAFEMAEELE